MKLHEMITDSEKKNVRIGRVVDIDIQHIEVIRPVGIWQFDKFLPEEERNKIEPEKLGKVGTLIQSCSGKYHVVIESESYIKSNM